ncbi:MAG: D-alanine--D-alanine ligase A, partial [Clostridia bacterium]|nr:D-alanine--D-alanine ligase A [Clostridia bacterium]
MMSIKICVIFGGKSSEHEVSCKSAYNVLKNLDKEKYEIIKFGITKEGATWL